MPRIASPSTLSIAADSAKPLKDQLIEAMANNFLVTQLHIGLWTRIAQGALPVNRPDLLRQNAGV